MLVAFDHAGRGGLGDHGLDLLFSHPLLGLAGLAQQSQHGLARDVEQPDHRRADGRNQLHGRRDPGGYALGIAQGDLLGHQLAQDQGNIGDGHDNHANADDIGDIVGNADGFEPVGEPEAQGGAGKSARQDTHQGDADLYRRQELARVLSERDGNGGAVIALVGHGAQARGTGGDNGQFRHGQQAVDDGQNDDDQNFYEQGTIKSCGPALGIGSLRTAI